MTERCKYYNVWFLIQSYVHHYRYINHCLQICRLNTNHKYKEDKNFNNHIKCFPSFEGYFEKFVTIYFLVSWGVCPSWNPQPEGPGFLIRVYCLIKLAFTTASRALYTLGLILKCPSPRRVATKLKGMEENRIPKTVLYMNLGTTRLRGRPRNRWQDEVREDGIVGGEGWQEKVHNREGWKKLLRMARIIAFCTCQWNERMNEYKMFATYIS